MQFSGLQIVAGIELALCWLIWIVAFMKPHREAKGQEKVVRAKSSQWGIGLVGVSFALTWAWVKPEGFEKSPASLILSMVLAPVSAALVWAATRELGKQWRYEAALTQDHELIQTGPYRWMRHPIYTSMFGMLMATAAALTWWPMWIASAAFFILGTEIRVRAEERLLAGRFQEKFEDYRARVPAYIPFIR